MLTDSSDAQQTPRRLGMPPVVVVVVTFNSSSVLQGCLDSLADGFGGIAHRTLVVDNASSDDTVEVARRCVPAPTIIDTGSNAGYAAAINRACAEVDDDAAVLILNPDARLHTGAVPALLRTLELPGTGVVVPRILDADGMASSSLRRTPTIARALGEAVLGGRRAGRIAALGEVVLDEAAYADGTVADWATGCALLVSAECRAAVGAWDEGFFLYSEETDYMLRARDLGFLTRLSALAFTTHIGGEGTQSPALWALMARNRVEAFRRRHTALATAAFRAAVALNEATRAARGSQTHRAGLRAVVEPWSPDVKRRAQGLSAGAGAEGRPDFICFSAQDWWYHNRAHSDFQLMRNIAQDRRVLFVNSIGMRMPTSGNTTMPIRRIGRKVRSIAKLVRHPLPEVPGFTVMTPVTVPLYHRARVRRVNAYLVAAQVRVVAALHGIRDPACMVTVPTAWDVLQHVPHGTSIYNRSDKHSAFPEADTATIELLEQSLMLASDHVLYVSRTLMDDEAALTEGRAVFLDHGVDLSLFQRVPEDEWPADIASIPGPRIGYFGAIRDYVIDLELLRRVAEGIPEAQLVLVGGATCPIDDLVGLPNVHWLGARDYEDIPRYGSAFDVALMPWLDNEWIRNCNPIKMKEYLALGLPVVTIAFPEVDRYSDVISVAHGIEDFVARTREALAENDSEAARTRRRAAVADASWQSRARVVEGLVDTI